MPDNDSLQQALAALQAEYAAKLPAKINAVDQARALLQKSWNLALFNELCQTVHRLAGEGGSYGFNEMGAIARQLDVLLREWQQTDTPLSAANWAIFDKYLALIKQNAEKSPQSLPMSTSTPSVDKPSGAPVETPQYLRLPEQEKKIGSYLLLQWNEIDANWKALQWKWDEATFASLQQQLRVLGENAACFQFGELYEALRETGARMRELQRVGGNPEKSQLIHLTHQFQAVTKAAHPLATYVAQPGLGIGRSSAQKLLRLTLRDPNLFNYLLLQCRALVDLWQTTQWSWQQNLLLQLQNHVMVLQNNCEQFKYAPVVEHLRAFHDALKPFTAPGKIPDEAQLTQLNQRITKAKEALQNLKTASPGLGDAAVETNPKLIYVIDDDEYLTRYLEIHLSSAGYTVKTFNRLAGLAETIQRAPPGALLVDIVLAEGNLAGPSAMFQIQKGRERPLPVIFMSARTDLKAHLAAARAAGSAYMTKPLDIDNLLATLEIVTRPVVQDKNHIVLLVDNTNATTTQEYVKILRSAHIEVKLLKEPGRFLEAVTKFQPQVILFNAHLIGVSAVELATVLSYQQINIPIVFYGMRFDQTWRLPIQRKVGDDFLGENVLLGQLLATVEKHFRRNE